jgi:hypothetical protein
LHHEVLRHVAEPVDSERLLRDIERYERTDLPSDARSLASDCEFLGLANNELQRQLGHRVEMHYRNANLRLAVSADLINRMVPKRGPEYAPVADTVLGIPVRGHSTMVNEVMVRFLPDPQRVRLALEVSGQVAATTEASSGPATFVTDSQSAYKARKPMEIDLAGIRVGETEVDVDNNSQLRRLDTNVDGVPLIGSLVRGIARSQHDQRMPAADAEVKQKIASQAHERVDAEVNAQVAKAANKLHTEVIEPMDSLLLDPTLIAAETNEQRFVMRIRLAGKDQLGSHTPRPQAPADSLASVQVHESVLNNVIHRLELDGQTFSMPELGAHIAQRLHRPPKPVDPDTEDVKITFAKQDPIRVRCLSGRIEITLAVEKLAKESHKWKDFQVRAYYRPEVRGRSVELTREGVVQLMGGRLGTGAQIALRGVFSRVFSQTAPWTITPEQFVANPHLQGLAVTQFVVDDGWIGAAIGPQRATALHPGLLRR